MSENQRSANVVAEVGKALRTFREDLSRMDERLDAILSRLDRMNGALTERCHAHAQRLDSLEMRFWAIVAVFIVTVVGVALKGLL